MNEKRLNGLNKMTSRERVLAALNHREPDRVPFDLNGSLCSGIHVIAYKNLLSYLHRSAATCGTFAEKSATISAEGQPSHLDGGTAALGLKTDHIVIHDTLQQLAWPDEEILRKLNVDTRLILPGTPSDWKLQLQSNEGAEYFVDQYGIAWTRPAGGLYFDPRGHPLAHAGKDDLKKYPWPDMSDPARVKGLKERARFLRANNYLITVERPIGGFYEAGFWLRGYENFYCDLAGDPDYAAAQMDKCLELEIEYWRLMFSEIGEYIDVVLTANDLAAQHGPLISPVIFRKYVKPRLKRLNAFIKKLKPDVFISLHCCGAIYDLIADFLETGVDIINPVQVSAVGMDTRKLKKDFGKDLTFWGGGVDTQKILPRGSPQQVKEEVRRRIADLAPGGGFVFAAVHNIQPDVPPANIMAMWEALQEYGKYF